MGEFQNVFQTAIGGLPVNEFWDGERKFDVIMRLPLLARDDVDEIRNLRIPVDGGVTVPLQALATVDTGMMGRRHQPRKRTALHRRAYERTRS